jgi:rfaE bifunctional protein kinase chain/domain
LNKIEEIFGKFAGLKVLVLGDVMVDSYIWGNVGRISPEAPVPIVSIHKEERRLGGAANVARNLHALGATPILCTVIGQDEAGQMFSDIMRSRAMTTDGVVMSRKRMTTVKERVLSGYQQLLRVDKETLEPLAGEDRRTLLEHIRRHLPEADVLIFEDYDKGVLGKSLIAEVVNLADQHNIPTVVDPKKANFLAYRGVSLFKPNLKEIREGLKHDFDAADNGALAKAVDLLRRKLEIGMALVTRSELGVYMDAGEEKHFIPAHIRSVSDVSGAGDTVVSTAALCLALGLPPKIIAGLSNLAGGLVCEHLGVVPVDRQQLYDEAVHSNLFDFE